MTYAALGGALRLSEATRQAHVLARHLHAGAHRADPRRARARPARGRAHEPHGERRRKLLTHRAGSGARQGRAAAVDLLAGGERLDLRRDPRGASRSRAPSSPSRSRGWRRPRLIEWEAGDRARLLVPKDFRWRDRRAGEEGLRAPGDGRVPALALRLAARADALRVARDVGRVGGDPEGAAGEAGSRVQPARRCRRRRCRASAASASRCSPPAGRGSSRC